MSSLAEQAKQFMYTHMGQAPYKKELLKLIETWESGYIARIQELEGNAASTSDAGIDLPQRRREDDDDGGPDWSNFG